MHAKTAENMFSVDYNDLSNAPDLSNFDQDNSDDFDGDYNSLVNKPTIPTSTSDLVNNSGFVAILNDDDATDELQNLSVSASGDTLHLQNGGFVIIPGISAANPSYPLGGSIFITFTLKILNHSIGCF